MEINAISLSNNTVQCSIEEITEKMKEQMTTRKHSSCFCFLQLDKFIYITELPNNLLFDKYNFKKT